MTTEDGQRVVGVNPTPFINRSQVRRFLLEYSRTHRAHKWSRVSEQTLISISEQARLACIMHVNRMPSSGKTL